MAYPMKVSKNLMLNLKKNHTFNPIPVQALSSPEKYTQS